MSKQINHVDAPARVAPFDGTYREILSLLEEARAFAATPVRPTSHSSHSLDGGALMRLEASCEALRVTSRLTHCLAWLLIHKAIHAGELSPEAAYQPENRLSGGPVCLAVGGEGDPRLPSRLRDLLAASRTLYARVARLDAGMA